MGKTTGTRPGDSSNGVAVISRRNILRVIGHYGPLTPAEIALALGRGRAGIEAVIAVLHEMKEEGMINWD